MATISGAFKNSSRYIGYTPANVSHNWGTGVNSGHNTSEIPDLGTPAEVDPTYVQILPEYLDEAWTTDPEMGMQYYPDSEQEDNFLDSGTFKNPNYKQHMGNNWPKSTPSVFNRNEAGYANAHKLERGADVSRRVPMAMRGITEKYETPREQSMEVQRNQDEPIKGTALRALRGRNSLPVNNPGDPAINFSGNYNRRGYEISRRSERRMYPWKLTHTKRPLHLNLATTAIDSPGVAGAHWSPYASGQSNNAKIALTPYRPYVRREPRSYSEESQTDGTEIVDEQLGSWGL